MHGSILANCACAVTKIDARCGIKGLCRHHAYVVRQLHLQQSRDEYQELSAARSSGCCSYTTSDCGGGAIEFRLFSAANTKPFPTGKQVSQSTRNGRLQAHLRSYPTQLGSLYERTRLEYESADRICNCRFSPHDIPHADALGPLAPALQRRFQGPESLDAVSGPRNTGFHIPAL